MKVTLGELRTLRATLSDHRIQHETLVTQMKVLRQLCQELRYEMALTSQTKRQFNKERVLSNASD